MKEIGIRIQADGAKQTGAQLQGVANAINGIGTKAMQFFGPAALGYAIASTARETFQFAAHMGDLSKKVGLNTDTLQAWSYAAEITGANLEDMTGAFRRLKQALGKAEGGNEDIKEMFAGLGITNLKNAEEVFDAIAKRVGEGNLSLKQQVDLTVLMGRNVNALFPAFKEGFADLKDEFKRLGLAIEEDIIQKIKGADDKLVLLKLHARKAIAGPDSDAVTFADEVVTGMSTANAALKAYIWGGGGIGGAVMAGQAVDKLSSDMADELTAIALKPDRPPDRPDAEGESPLEAAMKEASKSRAGVSNAMLRGFGGMPQADALARIGLYRGGFDSTRSMDHELKKLNTQFAVLLRNVQEMRKTASELRSDLGEGFDG